MSLLSSATLAPLPLQSFILNTHSVSHTELLCLYIRGGLGPVSKYRLRRTEIVSLLTVRNKKKVAEGMVLLKLQSGRNQREVDEWLRLTPWLQMEKINTVHFLRIKSSPNHPLWLFTLSHCPHLHTKVNWLFGCGQRLLLPFCTCKWAWGGGEAAGLLFQRCGPVSEENRQECGLSLDARVLNTGSDWEGGCSGGYYGHRCCLLEQRLGGGIVERGCERKGSVCSWSQQETIFLRRRKEGGMCRRKEAKTLLFKSLDILGEMRRKTKHRKTS